MSRNGRLRCIRGRRLRRSRTRHGGWGGLLGQLRHGWRCSRSPAGRFRCMLDVDTLDCAAGAGAGHGVQVHPELLGRFTAAKPAVRHRV